MIWSGSYGLFCICISHCAITHCFKRILKNNFSLYWIILTLCETNWPYTFRQFLGSLCCFSHLYVYPYAIVFIYTAILTTVPYLDYCSFISLEIRLCKPLLFSFQCCFDYFRFFSIFIKLVNFCERKRTARIWLQVHEPIVCLEELAA